MAADGHEQDRPHQDGHELGRPHRDGPHQDGHEHDGPHEDGHEHDGPHQDGPHQDGPAGSPPSRRDKRVYLVLMSVCIGLFVLSWAVLDRYSVTAAIVVSAVALVIPPFAVIIANASAAADRRRP